MDEWCLGRFKVKCPPLDYRHLEAAQQGCAILRCGYLSYAHAYDIVALHPDFENVKPSEATPEYDVEMINGWDGSPIRKRFIRLP